MSRSYLIEHARVVGLKPDANAMPVSVRIRENRVVELGAELSPEAGDQQITADGRWLIPGLWDQHVHMGQWAQMASRVDLSQTRSAQDVLHAVAQHAEQLKVTGSHAPIIAQGYRITAWPAEPEPGALDAVSAGHPTVLITGDGHTGWLNTDALAHFGLAGPDRLIDENEWFDLYARLGELTPDTAALQAQYRSAITAAHTRGIVGITDFEYCPNYLRWPEMVDARVGRLRVNAAFYPEDLEDVLSRGYKTGDALAPLVMMGPLKIIEDGSLSSLTAYCCDEYGAPGQRTRGKKNYSQTELEQMLIRATTHGLDVAVHAIGDAAASDVLDAFNASGAHGSIEHAQLMRVTDIERMANLDIVASVQPAHLFDDFPVIDRVWSDRADRTFALATMQRLGVTLSFGSDAPVSPLDPWLAIDAAVNRSQESGAPWHPAERLSAAEALFSSTNGAGPVDEGSLADLVLLEDDPLTSALRNVRTALTMIDGEVVFDATQ